jgi:hypothetical protein
MMRKGPLDRYPPEWVLREAGIRRVSGAVEFQTTHPVTVYLDDGAVYAAHAGSVADATTDDATPSEDAARSRVEGLLADLVDQHQGWYFHHPLDHHAGHRPWSWDPQSLLLAARRLRRSVPTAPAPVAAGVGPEPVAHESGVEARPGRRLLRIPRREAQL